MRVTFLGTGTSHGIPVIGCECAVCCSPDPRNRRLRPAVWVETAGTSLLIDVPPDFRQQALRERIAKVDAVLLTHSHADHFLGLDDLRVFTCKQGQKMPIYGSAQTVADVQRVFFYAMHERPTYPTLPNFGVNVLEPDQAYVIGDLPVRTVELPHGRSRVLGFVFGRAFAYLTDCHAVPPPIIESLQGVRVLALDALRVRSHPAHLTLAQAREIAEQVGAELTFFTHMNHETDHATAEAAMPAQIRLAYDGLQLEINETTVTKLA
ncbi:MAG: Phosphoribosyl 1,2-cyclic phosphate phosphodiesterase [Verrucomicrobiae bacterium]|nr:Phosphoribosyl 1,2-cyclic phosphate phosphodiesterase [Verrucomicrobiae bacterium]